MKINEKSISAINTGCKIIVRSAIGTVCVMIGILTFQKISVFYGKVFDDIQKAYE